MKDKIVLKDKLDINNLINIIKIDPKNILLLKLPSYVWAILLGLIINPLGQYYNIKTGADGVDYYGEVHKSKFNCFMHTIGMPFTIYGFLNCLPALFNLTPKQSIRFIYNLYFIYLAHYMSIDWKIGGLYTLIYTPVTVINALNKYSGSNNEKFKNGLLLSTIALTFQEGIGHYYGGDNPSRVEAIPNAILYAKYFSLYHLIYK